MGFKQSTLENLVINPQFWKGKKVFLTGHTGFKGSWMSLWLQKLGVNLIGFSESIPTEPSLCKLTNIQEKMISIFGDIRKYSDLEEILREHKPEIIIHMAAQSLVKKSYEDPMKTFTTNIMGTVNIFESIRQIGNPCIILNVTSDKCYENIGKTLAYTETDPIGGYDPYSSSKGCSELITSSYRNSFFNSKSTESKISLASVRAGNVIGGGDWSENRLVPDIMKGVLNKEKIKIRNPDSVRPWQFVLEPLHGYLLLIEKLAENSSEYDQAWNFGPNEKESRSVSFLIQKLAEGWGKEIQIECESSDRYEEKILMLNSDKARIKLGWQPKMNLELTIKWITEWYKKYQKGENMKKITEQQIDEYSLLS